MSKKFYAVNRVTGEKWKPTRPAINHRSITEGIFRQYLVMYDSGYLAVVTEDFYVYIEPLDPKIWKTVLTENKENNIKK